MATTIRGPMLLPKNTTAKLYYTVTNILPVPVDVFRTGRNDANLSTTERIYNVIHSQKSQRHSSNLSNHHKSQITNHKSQITHETKRKKCTEIRVRFYNIIFLTTDPQTFEIHAYIQ